VEFPFRGARGGRPAGGGGGVAVSPSHVTTHERRPLSSDPPDNLPSYCASLAHRFSRKTSHVASAQKKEKKEMSVWATVYRKNQLVGSGEPLNIRRQNTSAQKEKKRFQQGTWKEK
jgi:hypothetical protein